MYDTIIFDLDDTLTDDCENIRQAFKIVLEYKKEYYTEYIVSDFNDDYSFYYSTLCIESAWKRWYRNLQLYSVL